MYSLDNDQVAIAIMDEKVGDRVNVLNSARYRTRQKQARLHDLQLQYKQFAGDNDGDSSGSRSRSSERNGCGKRGESDTAKSGDSKEDEEGQVI